MEKFTDDDEGHMRWISNNPDGFVVNVERLERPAYAILHRSSCAFISRDRENGVYTEHRYMKVCGYAKSIGRADGSFSKQCGHCQPA